MRRLTRVIPLAVSAALALSAGSLRAQAPEGSEKLTAGAVAESLAVLKQLDSDVRKNPNNAAVWYHRGMLAWALYERDRNQPPIGGLDWTRLGTLADTSLRLAALIDKDNAQYRMMVGRFLLNSGVSITRLASYQMFTSALDDARNAKDPHALAETAIEVGRLHWRRYDAYENRWPDLAGTCSFIGDSTMDVGVKLGHAEIRLDVRAVMRREIRTCKQWMETGNTEYYGESDYVEAEAYFREAFAAQPSFDRAYRQLAMLLVDRNRWRELEVTAHTRLAAAPWDAWAWATLGLSLQRQRDNPAAARAAFDSALAHFRPEDAARLDHLERVLKPQDTTRVSALEHATHAASERFYWRSSDPLWSREGNEPRTEFLARLTYAELRWTAEEMRVHGADTDRGDVHIRYGPADLIVVQKSPASSLLTTLWVYESGMIFRFVGQPTFATAKLPPGDQLSLGEMQAFAPALWNNVLEISVDSMPAQAARFRAAMDSIDLYVATRPPVAQIRKSSDVVGGVRADFWVLANGLDEIAHDTARLDVEGTRVFEKRLGPGMYSYRAEASADGGRYASRAAAVLIAGLDTATGFSPRGFGMSDVLLAASASSRGAALRWHDLTIQPLLGTTVQKGQIALVWENYELGNERGSARYTVSISVERQRSLAGRIVAQVVGRVGSVVGVDRTDDKVTLHFERNVPYAPALLDNIALGLGETPVGNYRLTVSVEDHVTGRTTSRGMNLRVAEK